MPKKRPIQTINSRKGKNSWLDLKVQNNKVEAKLRKNHQFSNNKSEMQTE